MRLMQELDLDLVFPFVGLVMLVMLLALTWLVERAMQERFAGYSSDKYGRGGLWRLVYDVTGRRPRVCSIGRALWYSAVFLTSALAATWTSQGPDITEFALWVMSFAVLGALFKWIAPRPKRMTEA